MTPSVKASLHAWFIVALLCVIGALNYLDRNMITTMRQSIISAVPMTDAQFGLLTSAFLWVYGLLSPVAGYLADRFSRSGVIIGSLVVWSAVTWLTGHATTFEQLFIARALMGISEAAFIPAALALIADYHRGTTRSRANSCLIAGIMVGSGFGGMGGWLAERYGWAFPFTFFGLFGILYSVLLVFMLRDPKVTVENEFTPSKKSVAFGPAVADLLSNGMFLRALVVWGLVGITGWVLVGWAPTFFQERFHLSQGSAGLSVTGYFSSAGFAGVLLGGVIADRWSRSNRRARLHVSALGLCIAAPGIILMSRAPHVAYALGGLATYALTRNFLDANMMPIVCHVADERYRATGYGLLNLCACVIGGVGVYAGGALRDAHIGMVALFNFVVLGLAVAAILLFSIKPTRHA